MRALNRPWRAASTISDHTTNDTIGWNRLEAIIDIIGGRSLVAASIVLVCFGLDSVVAAKQRAYSHLASSSAGSATSASKRRTAL